MRDLTKRYVKIILSSERKWTPDELVELIDETDMAVGSPHIHGRELLTMVERLLDEIEGRK